MTTSRIYDGVDAAIAATTEPPAQWTLESAAAIVARGVPEPTFDIDGILPAEDGPLIMFGPPAGLKSWLALYATACMVSGRPYLGHFAVRRRSHGIYINLDAGDTAFKRRLVKAGIDFENLLIASPPDFSVPMLRDVFERYPGAFIVIDTFSDAFTSNRGDDQAQVMRTFVRGLRALYAEFGCNGIVVDHPRRPQEGAGPADYYGSVQKEATARTMWSIQRLPATEPGLVRVKIACRKMSEGEPFAPFVASFRFDPDRVTAAYEGTLDEASGAAASGPSDVERVEQILRDVDDGLARAALERYSGLSRDRVRAAVRTSGKIGTLGQARSLRYVLLESNGSKGDYPGDSEIDRNYRPESNGPPKGPRAIPFDSPRDPDIDKSNAAPFDSPFDSEIEDEL